MDRFAELDQVIKAKYSGGDNKIDRIEEHSNEESPVGHLNPEHKYPYWINRAKKNSLDLPNPKQKILRPLNLFKFKTGEDGNSDSNSVSENNDFNNSFNSDENYKYSPTKLHSPTQ